MKIQATHLSAVGPSTRLLPRRCLQVPARSRGYASAASSQAGPSDPNALSSSSSSSSCKPGPSSNHSRTPPLPLPPQQYPAHLPLYPFQRHLLTIGSTLTSFLNPSRGDMIALLSETSGEPFLSGLMEMVMASEEGRRVLWQRRRITTESVDMPFLEALPGGTFGRQYVDWLEWCRVGPDTRAQVRHPSSPHAAYLMQRYRESHDFYHLLCSMPVSTLGETVVKIFEASHFGLPVAFLSSLAGPTKLSHDERILLFDQGLATWAWKLGKSSAEKAPGGTLLSLAWEERWERNLDEMRKELGMDEPPPVQVQYNVKRGVTSKKRAWTTTTVQRTRSRQAAEAEAEAEAATVQ